MQKIEKINSNDIICLISRTWSNSREVRQMINIALDGLAYGPMAAQQVMQMSSPAHPGVDADNIVRSLKDICERHDDLSFLSYNVAWNGNLRQAVFVAVGSNRFSPRRRIVVEVALDPMAPPQPLGNECWRDLWLVVRQAAPVDGPVDQYGPAVQGFAPPERVAEAAKQLVRLSRLLQDALALPTADRVRLVALDDGWAMRPEGME